MRAHIVISLFVLLACANASATLGGTPSDFGSAAARARQLSASAPGGAALAYSITETTLDSGTVVREYTGPGGRVFAVSWNGPFLPDFRTLLGERFERMQAAAGERKRGRGPVQVNDADLVIESGGHMRAWSGRAWLPSALPAGVGAEVIQ